MRPKSHLWCESFSVHGKAEIACHARLHFQHSGGLERASFLFFICLVEFFYLKAMQSISDLIKVIDSLALDDFEVAIQSHPFLLTQPDAASLQKSAHIQGWGS